MAGIYRISAKGVGQIQTFDLSKLTGDELIALLSNKNKWTRQLALRMMGERQETELLPKSSKTMTLNARPAGIGNTLGRESPGGFDTAFALKALAHSDRS